MLPSAAFRRSVARLVATVPRSLLVAVLGCAVAVCAAAPPEASPATTAVDLGPKTFYLIDRAGTLTLDDVRSPAVGARFVRNTGQHPNFGFTRDWVWLRIAVRPPANALPPWTLEIGYPPLDQVEVYTPIGGDTRSGFLVRSTGDTVPFANRELPSRDYLFRLDLQPDEEQTIYIRVRSESSLTVPLRLLSPAGMEQRRGETFVLAVFFGALLALALFNLLLYITLRDRSYLFYVAFVATTAMAYLCFNGIAFQYLWPESPAWNNRSPLFFGHLTIATGALFARGFLRAWEHGRRYDIPTVATVALALAFALGTAGPLPYWISARAFPFLAIAAAASVIVNSVHAMRRGYRPARVFLMAWAALIAGLLAFAMRSLELLPSNFLTLHGVQIGSLVETLLLAQALAQRIQTMREAAAQAQAAALAAKESALAAQQQALEASRLAEMDLETMVAERVQELARVNRTLEAEIFERKRAEELLRRLAYHDSLTGLPNRTLLRDRFAMAASAARRNDTRVALLVIDLDDFKAVNEAHGHDVGDDLLVSFAKLLQNRMREMDTIARLGGDEFVVVVNDLATHREAARVAEKVLSILNEPVRVSPTQTVRASASIGIAVHGLDGDNVEELLKRAEASMYQAKKAGHGVYRFATIPADA